MDINSESETYSKGLQKIEHVGQIPETLKQVVANNLFKDIAAFEDRVLKTEICSTDEETRTTVHTVKMLDVYGNEIASYTLRADNAYHITTLTATEDGGFLFVLGFTDYAYTQEQWASENGFVSRIIKCDKEGNLQFDTSYEGIEGEALSFCYEKEGKFYFFGTLQTPETKIQGVHSPTDIYMTILDEKGTILKSQLIAGSDYDSLYAAEYINNGFLLSIRSQSCDGDFDKSNSKGYPKDYVITVNENLEITEKKKETGREYFDDKIGHKEDGLVYKSDDLFKNFDAGTPNAYIDYGDFYIIVSEHVTGSYEHTPPVVSSIWPYTETVYSGYDQSGNLIFRTAVDSSPDYDAIVVEFYN
jgi:hypothetical protein